MVPKVDALINNYEKVLKEPWKQRLSGQEKVWFLVYDPSEQRKVLFRLGDFERVTRKHGRNWLEINLSKSFSQWMSQHEYREAYFKNPSIIQDQVESEFKAFAISLVKEKLEQNDDIENTVIAITHVSALFGFIKLSDVLQEIYPLNKGRILIFFPGEFHNNHYRLMDARDGWSYLARPITA